MFKIFPLCDEALQEKYLSLCNAKRKPDAFIYAMCDIESGEVMAISQFEIYSSYGYIYDIKSRESLDDFEAMFILTRQTMNFIEKCGPTLCLADKSTADAHLLKAAGFKETEDGYSVDMTNMFTGGCGNH